MARPAAGICSHCKVPVIRDPQGCWIHTSLRYSCTGRWGLMMPSYAEPAPARGVAPVRR